MTQEPQQEAIAPVEKQLEQKICTKDNPLSEVLLLDSGSSCNTVSNEDLVIDERPAKHPMELATNNGNSMMTREATIHNLGTTYFDPNHVANIVSLYLATQGHFVKMESWMDNAFWVQPFENGKNG